QRRTNSSTIKRLGFSSQNAQRYLFHLLGLRGGLIIARLKFSTVMLPSHVDSGSHIVSQDDELRRPAVVIAAKADDVPLSHSGRKIARKLGESKGGLGPASI